MANVKVLEHPVLIHKLAYLRDKNTKSVDFRRLMYEISSLIAFEAMQDWDDFVESDIESPIAKTKVKRIQNPPIIVSILRAGNGMLDAILDMLPISSTGFIGIYRDKFIHNTVEYYFKLPEDTKGKTIFLCDPLVSTADTAIAAIDRLKAYEVGKIHLLTILISQEAVDRISHFHPDVVMYAIQVEKEVNKDGYLVPGLGDAGDRLFQTK